MDEGSDTPKGSWNQRNSALFLFSVVSDTLNISNGSAHLQILDIVEESNGYALYTLVIDRLRDVKSSDPIARAMKLKLGLQHIQYKIIPHGVATYFAEIKAHRTKLLALPKPKHISDWEVVAKALQELPPIHPKFEAARNLLELERKIHNRETSLNECKDAFINAEIDNNVYADLKRRPTKRKPKIRINNLNKRLRPGHESKLVVEYPEGSCVHHPKSKTHTSSMCTNPFGCHVLVVVVCALRLALGGSFGSEGRSRGVRGCRRVRVRC